MVKPTLQSKNLSEAKFAKYAENIVVKMTENVTLFPEPDPSLATLEAALEAFNRSLADATYRDMRQIVIKNQQFATLKNLVFEMSLYVTKVTKGDPALILAAGFLPTKSQTPVGPCPKPENFRVELLLDNSGYVRLRVKAWKPALMYQFEYRRKQSEEAWKTVLSSKSSTVIADLESLQEYEFRVAYIGRNPLMTYSDVVASYVL